MIGASARVAAEGEGRPVKVGYRHFGAPFRRGSPRVDPPDDDVDLSSTRDDYHDFLVRRHRPAHRGRTADRWAAFLLPHLRADMRVLDLGCGPGTISAGLPGCVIGMDLHPLPLEDIAVVGGDAMVLPFRDESFDALYLNAILQHVEDAGAVMREAQRVARPGAVIGVGDADWGSRIMHPHDPLIERGQAIQEAVRDTGNVRVGRELRGLLTGASFERVELAVEGRVVGSEAAANHMAAFERGWFDAVEVVAHVSELRISDPEEMAEIALAWTRWAADPAACATDLWFTALGWSAPSSR